MNDFEAKHIKIASQYLEDKLKSLPKVQKEPENVFKVEEKKISFYQRFLNLIFNTSKSSAAI
ncbi:MAG: hypothetical protein DRG78_24070 [Epsilonproteobacteria bacterium]|nr:MAG: hypothetical protein DRG78_24070 [Campylobacterota bacterium]